MTLTFEEIVDRFISQPIYLQMGSGKLSTRWGVSRETIHEAKQRARGNQKQPTIQDNFSKKVNNETGTFESSIDTTYDPKNDLELAELHKIDLTRYKISNYWSKLKSTGKFTSSVLATRRKADDIQPEDILLTLTSYKSDYKPLTAKDIFINTKFDRKSSAFIDITDFHLDKRDIMETSVADKVAIFHEVLDTLLFKAYQSNNLDEIAFVVGSDMLHTDTIFNTTTKGTPQETDLRWNESFDLAFELYVQSINKLKQFCNTLKIILIQGNHGFTKEYYLAFALKKYFEKETNIHFDIDPVVRKVYVYGNTFIGLHHGNCKLDKLPIIFSKEFAKEWGAAKYHEIKVGDQHHFMEKDYAGVRIKQLPAVSGTDTWHNNANYVCSDRGAICSVYDEKFGRSMDIEHKI